MHAEAFIDTNVLVYAISSDRAGAAKASAALDLIENVDFGLSTQVMSEFYVTATQKIARPLSYQKAIDFLQKLRRLPIVDFDTTLVFEAIELEHRYKISYWDAAIVAAAQRLQAATIYSEDLNHGQLYGNSRVTNPFRTGK
jgi:predicted nucleic acid-binding protein